MIPPKSRPKLKIPPVIRRRSLTVCIASFAQESRAIVCIADRAVTYPSYGSPVQSDSGMKKIIDIGNTGWCALFSGDSSFAQQVVAKLTTKAGAAGAAAVDFNWMETNAETIYQECFETLVENKVLRPYLLRRDTFISRSKDLQPLDSQIVSSINSKLQEFEFACQIMFCGFDANGPHLFTVVEPGAAESNDLEGHNAIGIGRETATSRIAWLETESSESLVSVFYDLFDAKVASEIIQGVGYEWDGKIIVRGKPPIEITKPIKKLIDQGWIVSNSMPFGTKPVARDDTPPKTWKSKLTARGRTAEKSRVAMKLAARETACYGLAGSGG